jgi:hypothetical protein
MKKLFYLMGIVLLFSATLPSNTNYSTKLVTAKNNLRAAQSDSVMSSVLFNSMIDSIFPAWMGTNWDFNGTSNVPKQGEIACGYFVSTTLKHVGFNLNRYKLAQQAASVVIDVLCGNNKAYSTDKSALINKLKAKKGNRLYVVGLDYHVGFIAVQNNEVYFIHSDYFNNKVVKEFAFKSQGFSATNSYVYGEITNNSSLLNKWKLKTKIY